MLLFLARCSQSPAHFFPLANSPWMFSEILPFSSNTPPPSPQVVQMAWQEQTPWRAWWDCRQYTRARRRPRQAHHIWQRHSGECCLNYHCTAPNYQLTEAASQPPWGPVEPDWWWWQWKGWCWWVKCMMLVSFSNSTDRWSRFGLKVVLISPLLSGVKWDKVDETVIGWKAAGNTEIWAFCLIFFFYTQTFTK